MPKRVARRPVKKREDLMYFIAALTVVSALASISYFSTTALVSLSPTALAAGWPTAAGPSGTYSTLDSGPTGKVPSVKWIFEADQTLSPPVISTDSQKIAVQGGNETYVLSKATGERLQTIFSGGAAGTPKTPVWVTYDIVASAFQNAIVRYESISGISDLKADLNTARGVKSGDITASPAFAGGYVFVGTKNGVFGLAENQNGKLAKSSSSSQSNTGGTVTAGPAASVNAMTCEMVWKKVKERCVQGGDYASFCRYYVDAYKNSCISKTKLSSRCSSLWAGGTMSGDVGNCNYGTGLQDDCKFFFELWNGRGGEDCRKYNSYVESLETSIRLPTYAFSDGGKVYAYMQMGLDVKNFLWWDGDSYCRPGDRPIGGCGGGVSCSRKPDSEKYTYPECTWKGASIDCACTGMDIFNEAYCDCTVTWSEKLWEKDLAASLVLAEEDGFWVGTKDGNLMKFSALDGSELNSFKVSEKAVTAFAVTDRPTSGKQFATVNSDGKLDLYWDAQRKAAATDVTSVIIAGERGKEIIFAGSSGGKVYAIDPRKDAETGPVWEYDAGEAVKGLAISGNELYVSAGKKVVAIATDTVKPRILQPFGAGTTNVGVDENNYWQRFPVCIKATDDMGIKSLTISADRKKLNCPEYVHETAGTEGWWCSECEPLVPGIITWKATVEDKGGNIRESDEQTIVVSERQAEDTGPPICTAWLGAGAAKEAEIKPSDGIAVRATCTDDNGFNGGLASIEVSVKKDDGEEKALFKKEAFGAEDELFYACLPGECTDGTELSKYTITVSATDGLKKTSTRTADSTLTLKTKDVTPPNITAVYSNTETPEPSKIVTLTAKAADNGQLDSGYFTIDGRRTDNIAPQGGTFNYNYNVPDNEGQRITWQFTARDAYGNEAQTEDMTFTIADITPPVLIVNKSLVGTIMKGQTQAIPFKAIDNVKLG
ncbi:MAG: PQQ-binding-like beta-propeller repeat protein, partial [Candidatus Aenigmatarchaeota archaeon]